MKDFNDFKVIYQNDDARKSLLNNASLSHENFTCTILSENKKYIQNVNIITKLNNDLKVINWSAFNEQKFIKMSVIDLAKNFEETHPNYEVVCGFNADYFNYEGQSINANIIYGNRVIKSDNHQKYFSLEINPDGKLIKYHKVTDVLENRVITINDKESHLENSDFELILKTDSKDEGYNYFSLKTIYENIIGNHFYFEGIISNDDKDSNYLIKISDKNKNLLKNNDTIKVQHQLNNFDNNNLLVGADTYLIKNNKRLELNEITGQNFEHNTEVHPRTAFGYDKKGNFKVITIDGRLEESYGVNLLELSKIMHDQGFVEGINFDGGGSTQLVLRLNNELKTINLPSEYPLRPVGNVLLFIKEKAE